MDNTTIIVIAAVVLLAIVAIIIGRRLVSGSVSVGGLTGKIEGQKPGASVSENQLKGKGHEASAEGSDARIQKNKVEGENIKINAKS